MGIVYEVLCTWWLSWLTVERPWSTLARLFLSFFSTKCYRNHFSALVGLHFRHCKSEGVFTGRTAKLLLMSGHGQGREPQEN